MNILEQYRSLSLRHTMALRTVRADWPARRALFLGRLPSALTANAIINLGDALSDAFRCSGAGDRSQTSLSGSGTVWSGLVAWYLNLCYAGTSAIAFCGSKFVPECIKDAFSVNYNNTSIGADLDVLVLAMPGLQGTPSVQPEAECRRQVHSYCASNFQAIGAVIIQCKTNWNDNAQVPMLWNLLYKQAKRGVIPENGYTFGRNGFNIRNLGHFGYAFVTVPTSSGGPEGFGPRKLPVLRVQGMTGGAYWGHPTKNGVCRSIKEFPNHQFNLYGSIMPNVMQMGVGYAQHMGHDADQVVDTGAFLLH